MTLHHAALGRLWRRTIVWATLLLSVGAGAARADTLVVGGLTYNGIRITAVRNGEVFFTILASGSEVHKPLAHVSRITLSDEPAFNSAEEAYSNQQWDRATEGYERTLRTTQKPWLKEWVSLRLLESANNGGRFDAAVQAYIAMAERSPEMLQRVKLNMPKPDSAYLKVGIKLVNTAIERSSKPATKDALFGLLVELHKAGNDLKGANAALARQLELKAADPSTPEGSRAAVALKLHAIRLALEEREYDKVLQIIQTDGHRFIEPADQAEALFCLAEAQAGQLGNSKDVNAWKDVALAYMRVVANCPPSAAQTPAALMKTAAIHETHLGEKQTALRIYEQVLREYKEHPVAKDAERAIRRLKR